MTLSDLTRWTALVLATWLLATFAFGCARSSHVKAVNTAAVTLEATAHELLAEYERGRPDDTDEARVYAERWVPVVHALSAAYAAHDGWRILVERNADDIAIIAAASRAREALCELERAIRSAAPTFSTGALCGAHTRGGRRGRRLRNKRKRDVRARTISLRHISQRELAKGRQLYPESNEHLRPKTRAECVNGPRPCPFVSCKHHLYLDVSKDKGSIKLNFPDIEVEEMVESCALDIADRGAATLEKVGEVMNMTRERVRQLQNEAFVKLRVKAESA